MNEQALFAKQQAVKNEFDALSAKKAQKDTEMEEMNTELARLQGEWRMVDKLRKELADVPAVLPPTTAFHDPQPDKKAKK